MTADQDGSHQLEATAALTRVGEQLRGLASDAQRLAADAILARARERRLRVLVAGEAKRGKSTLLNRLLERELLPTGVLPVTAISTTVHYGERDELRVRYLDGREARHRLDELARFVTERANPENALRIADVEAVLAGGRLAAHPVELVDTPGTGSVFEHNTQAAQDSYAGLDAVILVLTATPPINAAERALLTEVSRHAVRTFVVLNKADQLAPDELAETVEFTAAVCADAGVPTREIFALSARDADAGFVEFRRQFEAYLHERAARDSERALHGHVTRLAQQMRDEAAIELRAVELARSDVHERLVAFSTHVDALAAQATDLADRCHATERRLRRELDQHARELGAELTRRCHAQVEAALAGFGDLAPADVERRGRDIVERVVTQAVLDWRAAQARQLERSLAALVETIERDRVRQLESLRQSAADELGVTVTGTVEPLPLQAGRLFWLDFADAPAVELPGTQLLRRHGPRAAQRARQRVLGDLSTVTDRQVGRARADLQQRLAETMRRLVAALRLHHADTLSRLQQALRRADETSTDDHPRAQQELDRLRDRAEHIDGLLARLGQTPDY